MHFDLLDRLNSSQTRQCQTDDGKIWLPVLSCKASLLTSIHLRDDLQTTLHLQQAAQLLSDKRMVLDEQDAEGARYLPYKYIF